MARKSAASKGTPRKKKATKKKVAKKKVAKTGPKPRIAEGPLLDLSTFSKRRHVLINKRPYDIRNPDELSAVQLTRLGTWADRIDKIQALPDAEITDEIEAELSDLLDRVCRVVMDAPDRLHKKLGDNHRIAVAHVFTNTR